MLTQCLIRVTKAQAAPAATLLGLQARVCAPAVLVCHTAEACGGVANSCCPPRSTTKDQASAFNAQQLARMPSQMYWHKQRKAARTEQ